jgi:hypothetical protein
MSSPDGWSWEVFDAPTNAVFHGLLDDGVVYIAVGETYDGDVPVASIWSSTDARQWTEMSFPYQAGSLSDIAAMDNQMVAVGWGENGDALVWMTNDGETWDALTSESFQGTRLVNVVSADGIIVATGRPADSQADIRPIVLVHDFPLP